MSDTQPAIIVKDVKKSFRIPLDKSSGIKDRIVNFYKRKKGYREFNALKGVSFEVKKGEFLGIVGRNGSGKSTLLKILAGVYSPDSGGVAINGSLTPFIELGVGFNPELTGRENVFLNGALLGFSKKEMEAMYDSIVDFAELHDFMEERLKNYSSGMQVRLAFSIAIRADSDILLLDEVLAVGDEAFQRKCYEYFAQLKQEKKTVILVTHDMNSVQRFCNKAVLIDSGQVKLVGNTGDVTKKYEELNKEAISRQNRKQKTSVLDSKNFKAEVVTISSTRGKADTFLPEETIQIKTKLIPEKTIKNAFFGITLQKSDGEYVYWLTTESKEHEIKEFTAGKPIEVLLELQNIFGENKYFVNIVVKDNNRTKDYLVYDHAVSFNVTGHGRNGWMLHPDYKLKITES